MTGYKNSKQTIIFDPMKLAACLLMVVWTLLLVEPGFASYASKASTSACSKSYKPAKPSCSPSGCSKSEEAEKPADDECKSNRCNPLMSCPTGNFYLSGYSQILINPFVITKKKTVLINDNRIAKHLSECWHPPEII